MAETNRHTYDFRSEAAPGDAFQVVRFTGEEGLSRPYAFDIQLVSSRKDLDPTKLVQSPAVFSVLLDSGELPIHGIPALFEMQNAFEGFVFYRVVLVPKLWWLTLTRHNQIFLGKDLQGFLTDALVDGGLTQGRDFEFRLTKSYPTREYVCQYGESHFDFVSRWMERDGLYYFFEQTPAGEKMVITDARTSHTAMTGAETLTYSPQSGLDFARGERVIQRFTRTRHQVPQTVSLTDYNYRKPAVRPQGQSLVSPRGTGTRHIFGEHPVSDDEAKELARVRAEDLACRETRLDGMSAVPHLRSGYLFKLTGHFRDDANTTYLTTWARHEGGQEGYLAQSLGLSLANVPDAPSYRNTFSAIPGTVQYRSRQKTEKPRIHGVLSAKVDAAQSGEYAELDSQGRYKVILPFDLSGRRDGKASSWLRMIEPYGGSNHGFHFPLHKGCEVLLVFLDGDPDRPVIQAAVPNPDHKSLLTSENNTKCMLTTSGGNQMHIEDQKGSERILLRSPTANSWARCGHPNDPPAADDTSTWSKSSEMLGWKLNTSKSMNVQAGLCNELILGMKMTEVLGDNQRSTGGELFEFTGVNKSYAIKSMEVNFLELILRLYYERATGEQVELNEECLEIAGELKKVKGGVSELEESKKELNAAIAKAQGNLQKLTQAKQELTATKSNLEGDRNTLGQSNLQLNATKQRVTQSKQTLVAQKQTIAAQKQAVSQQKTKLALNNTKTAGQITAAQTTKNDLAEMRSAIKGFAEIE